MGKFLIITICMIAFLGCQKPTSGLTAAVIETDGIPATFEDPSDAPVIDQAPPASPAIETKFENPPPVTENNGAVQPPPVQKPETKPEPKLDKKIELPQRSKFISIAEKVMVYEGKRIGTPCNFYLQRVLEVAGFPDGSFTANDFDLYARRHFRNHKSVDFKNDRSGSEIARLKQHIWSYPERTPFIMQWSRNGAHGHVAIVERIDDKIIIYQASLRRHTARKDQTTVQALLSGFNRRTLTVYSEFAD